jgi:tRNA (guanine37-N1)-methyltransferase
MKEASAQDESFASGLLDAPHYTRPEVWREQGVPAVLLSGHHADIARWRLAQAREKTASLRPDLFPESRATDEKQNLRKSAQNAGGEMSSAVKTPSSTAKHKLH